MSLCYSAAAKAAASRVTTATNKKEKWKQEKAAHLASANPLKIVVACAKRKQGQADAAAAAAAFLLFARLEFIMLITREFSRVENQKKRQSRGQSFMGGYKFQDGSVSLIDRRSCSCSVEIAICIKYEGQIDVCRWLNDEK